PPRRPTPLPYTTLFRSAHTSEARDDRARRLDGRGFRDRRHRRHAARGLARESLLRRTLHSRVRDLHGADVSLAPRVLAVWRRFEDRKSTRLNSSHVKIS